MRAATAVALGVLVSSAAGADWPMPRGGPERRGFTADPIRPPFRVAWARHFAGERLSSGFEPVAAAGKVFAATHAGSVHALDAASGQPLWRYGAHGAFLSSPAIAGEALLAASTDGFLHALEAATGKPRWSTFVASGGCGASPLVLGGLAIASTRSGEVVAVDLTSGIVRWRLDLGANRYLAALLACARLAERAALPVIKDIQEWDRFLSRGDALFFALAPHKAKVALFQGFRAYSSSRSGLRPAASPQSFVVPPRRILHIRVRRRFSACGLSLGLGPTDRLLE